ncbi:MAG: hypothetical protein AAGI69_28705 [Cyanobacteria bacterium P01_H01_bin.21]
MDTIIGTITVGDIAWVILWAGIGCFLSAVTWSPTPNYKDFLSSTLGIGIEAFGMEVLRGGQTIVAPLFIVLLLGIHLRFLPQDRDDLKVLWWESKIAFRILLVGYLLIQVFVSLLAYKNLLGDILPAPNAQ